MSDPRVGMKVRASRLYQDIHLDHRDAMYRAMTFIARHGGPPLPGDAKESLIAHREATRDWLLAQQQPAALITDYQSFLERWSPVFSD